MAAAIRLWPLNQPRLCPAGHGQHAAAGIVYPAGRRALSAGLADFALGRADYICVPMWLGLHPLSAVGRCGTPVPVDVVVKHNIAVSAYVFYEQWGWPFSIDPVRLLRDRGFLGPILFDSVDSANLDADYRNVYAQDPAYAEVFSLFKLLGLQGGGLLRRCGEFVPHNAKNIDEKWNSLGELWNKGGNPAYFNARLRDFLKEESPFLLPDVEVWLQENNLLAALAEEAIARRQNLQVVLASAMGKAFPDWMCRVSAEGAAPGLFPALRGGDQHLLEQARDRLQAEYNCESAIYHFNFSGNPLGPDYDRCLAVPMHGQVAPHMQAICSLLSSMGHGAA